MPRANAKKTPPAAASPRIAVLVDTATTWGRGILSGIHNYSRQHGPWQLFFEPRGMEDTVSLPVAWQGEGVIARIGNPAAALNLSTAAVPVVNVSAIQCAGPQFPRVANDVEAVARLAVAYFRQRGFRHFAYLSLMGLEYVSRQRDAFVAAVAAEGCESTVHAVTVSRGFHAPDWNLNLDNLAAWLLTLPKPVAVFTWSGGREIIHACQKAGLHVPQDVALLSGSDDELMCGLSPLPISGVQAASERIGHEAAALLDRQLRGANRSPTTTLIAPLGVVTRQSTDTLAITDAKMRAALNLIHGQIDRELPVDELARATGLSRSGLERRFRSLVGSAPADYIGRLRIERVKALLKDTTLPIAVVSEQAGFSSPEYMTTVFRRVMATTPLQYRRSVKSE
jgi:LacI family transcriptional regulator